MPSEPLKVGGTQQTSRQRQREATFSFLALSILALSSSMCASASPWELGPLSVPPQACRAEQPPTKAAASASVQEEAVHFQ